MPVNEFKAFATGENANVISQAEYEVMAARDAGFETGIARSEQLNKVWRQASTIAAVVAQFMADKSGDDVADDGNIEKLRDTLTKALMNNATGQLDGRYLKSSSNLEDVANAATARGNLGLKGAALLNVGTATGTVAAGNDSRIVNAAQRGNNLSDLTDKGVARNNLGLKGAALVDVGTSADTVAAGNDSRIVNALQRGNNLSDLPDKGVARRNLGIKGAALVDIGTTAGTVAAGNDSRIVNAAQRGNNLSDLTDKGAARNNLGLGTAAQVNVQVSKDDATAGRAVLNGNTIALRTNRYNNDLTETDFNAAPENAVTFVYGGASNGPGITGSVLDFSGLNGGYNVQLCGSYIDGGKYLKFRTRNGDKKNWGGWNSIYHSGNKPTATDVGGLPITGGALSGDLIIKDSLSIRYEENAGAVPVTFYSTPWCSFNGTKPYYELYVVKSEDSTSRQNLYNISFDVNKFEKGKTVTNTAQLYVFGTITPQDYSNFDARYYTKSQSDAGYMPKTSAYTKAESDGRYYTKAQSDAGYMAKVSAYTKSESDTRYVQGVRVSATSTRPFRGGDGWSQNDSAFVTGITMVGGMSNSGTLMVRYLQRNINGVWANVVA